MLENMLFLINIPKIAVSARRSVIRHTFVLKFHFITQQFLLVKVQGWFCPRRKLPSLLDSMTRRPRQVGSLTRRPKRSLHCLLVEVTWQIN